jgi:hypothetical protein
MIVVLERDRGVAGVQGNPSVVQITRRRLSGYDRSAAAFADVSGRTKHVSFEIDFSSTSSLITLPLPRSSLIVARASCA